ncbi:trypsin-like peptidase domain-containing protein [Saprospiraceae bacterium]|nr:trypsin-like peptidase domain-containing protein [Saprospiraceae bacterium]
MSRIFSLISAGIIGGIIVLSGNFFFNKSIIEVSEQQPTAVLTSAGNDLNLVGFDFVTASEKVTPAVVHITASESQALANQRRQKQRQGSNSHLFDFFGFDDYFGSGGAREGTGSGVIISSDGYIVTNNHVVDNSDIINVALTDKKMYKAIKIGTDPSTDLALLKIEATGLTAVKFADSDKVRVGEWVAAIGNPFSYLESTVTAGIVSAKGRDLDIIKGKYNIEEFIQTDAAINPGNSGGALVNVDGDLVGINTAIATPTGVYAGYSFAIPSNIVMTIIEDIKANGNIERGRLGIEGFELNPENVEELKLDTKKGFYVESVVKGSGAQFAGVLPGDIVIEANNLTINKFDDLYKIVEFAKVGDKIDLEVIRSNKRIQIAVYLKKGI